ncbi:hypothetical protein [Propionivibrio sp.]|uniref:hypothetical protein n=1 Tax=Propionivibrio sp. TaxID=2212460 RepID=UPI0026324361|nr:hypothetical protein [Propionivibrio sp.]
MPYDLEGAKAFMALSRQLETTGISRFELRRIGSIGNAVEIQIEEGYGNSEAVRYLIKALYAVASTYEKTTASNIAAVIKKMESLVSTMKT